MLLIASLRRAGSWRIPNRPCFIILSSRSLRLFTEETVIQPPRLFFGEKGSRRSSTIELGTRSCLRLLCFFVLHYGECPLGRPHLFYQTREYTYQTIIQVPLENCRNIQNNI